MLFPDAHYGGDEHVSTSFISCHVSVTTVVRLAAEAERQRSIPYTACCHTIMQHTF